MFRVLLGHRESPSVIPWGKGWPSTPHPGLDFQWPHSLITEQKKVITYPVPTASSTLWRVWEAIYFVVYLHSYVWLFGIPWTAACQASPSFTITWSLFAQTHVHWVGDAIPPSHPLLSPSPPAFSLSQHQGLFQWVSSSHQMAKVLKL